jgi:phage/plasmid-like protein (TIGR03299 family)
MSRETLQWLNTQTLIGYTARRGTAWHYRAGEQGGEPNHYEGPVPVADVRRRLFSWTAVEGEITATALTPHGVVQGSDPDRKAVMRSDTGAILGVFRRGYRPHQYEQWLVQAVETILDADLCIGSAGLLRGGAQAWVQVELADTLHGAQGVAFRPFLTAATSLDGSLASTYLTGVQVVVCDNTLSAALGESGAQRIRVKHSSRSLGRITDVRQALGIVHRTADAFTTQLERLLAESVSDDRFRRFVDAWTSPTAPDAPHSSVPVASTASTASPGRESGRDLARAGAGRVSGRSVTLARAKADDLWRLWRHDERVAPWAGTAYGVLAAVNTYTHHHATVRGATRAERNAGRVITGGHDTLDRHTLDVLAAVG